MFDRSSFQFHVLNVIGPSCVKALFFLKESFFLQFVKHLWIFILLKTSLLSDMYLEYFIYFWILLNPLKLLAFIRDILRYLVWRSIRCLFFSSLFFRRSYILKLSEWLSFNQIRYSEVFFTILIYLQGSLRGNFLWLWGFQGQHFFWSFLMWIKVHLLVFLIKDLQCFIWWTIITVNITLRLSVVNDSFNKKVVKRH